MLDLGTLQYAARCSKREDLAELIAMKALSNDTSMEIDVPFWWDNTDWEYVTDYLYRTYAIDLTEIGLVE